MDIRIVKDKSKANLIFASCADFGFCNTGSGKFPAYVSIGGNKQHIINWSPRASLQLNYAGDRYLTPTHEFGHALGLWHQNNNSNAIMSYAKKRSIRALDYERVINAYGVSK